MAAEFAFLGLPELRAAFDKAVATVDVVTRDAVAAAAHLVEGAAKQHATGRPGPNVVTGTLRRSILVEGPTRLGATGWAALIGPTVIYGRRVELGFTGADSLGRRYNQPPYPYLGPAYAEVLPKVEALMAARWAKAVGG